MTIAIYLAHLNPVTNVHAEITSVVVSKMRNSHLMAPSY